MCRSAWLGWVVALLLALLPLHASDPSVVGAGPPPMLVLTVATKENDALRNLRQSAVHYGFELVVLGDGLTFNRTGLKVDLFLDALAAVPDERVVMCIDSYDVVLLAPSQIVEQIFRDMRTPILMASERGCWPEAFCTQMASVQYPADAQAYQGYPFLNSGGYVGFAGPVRTMLKDVARWPVYEDQQAITRYYLEHQHDPAPLIQLDTQAKIFICLTLLQPGEMAWAPNIQRYYSRHTGQVPLVFHGNGDDGSALLIELMDAHPPPFPVNTTAWNKTKNSPLKQAFSFWVLEDPDEYAPTHLPAVDQLHFWYRQGAVSLSSGKVDSAIQAFVTTYELFLEHFHELTISQRQDVNRALTDIKDRFMAAMDDTASAGAGDSATSAASASALVSESSGVP